MGDLYITGDSDSTQEAATPLPRSHPTRSGLSPTPARVSSEDVFRRKDSTRGKRPRGSSIQHLVWWFGGGNRKFPLQSVHKATRSSQFSQVSPDIPLVGAVQDALADGSRDIVVGRLRPDRV